MTYRICNCDYPSKSRAFGKDNYQMGDKPAVIPSCKEKNRLIAISVITGEWSGDCASHPGRALWRFGWEWQQQPNERLAKLKLMTTLHIIQKLIHYTQWKEPCNTNKESHGFCWLLIIPLFFPICFYSSTLTHSNTMRERGFYRT